MLKSLFQRVFGDSKQHPLRPKIERFIVRARKVLLIAQQAAEARGNTIIESEHILLGLLHEQDGIARAVLISFEPSTEKIEKAITDLMSPAPTNSSKAIEISKNVKQILEFAVDEARRMSIPNIGTEHLLMGVVRQKGTVAMKALEQLGVTPQMVRAKIKAILAEQSSST